MTPDERCPSRIAAACDCRTWCRDATALDRIDPHPGRPGAWPAYPTEQP